MVMVQILSPSGSDIALCASVGLQFDIGSPPTLPPLSAKLPAILIPKESSVAPPIK